MSERQNALVLVPRGDGAVDINYVLSEERMVGVRITADLPPEVVARRLQALGRQIHNSLKRSGK